MTPRLFHQNPFFQAKAKPGVKDTSLERILHAALDRAGIAYVTQMRIGRYTVDVFLDQGIIIEADSERYHPNEDVAKKSTWALRRYHHDRDRDAYLASRGYAVVRARSKELRTNPDLFIEEQIKPLLEVSLEQSVL